MRKLILLGILFGAIVTFLASPYIPKREVRESVANIRRSFEVTCTVEPEVFEGKGTGVLLNTGYVLTAGHNVNADKSGDLTLSERKVNIYFGDDYFEGYVIYHSEDNDFAIVEIKSSTKVGAVASTRATRVGDRVHTVGATGGHPPTVSDGYIVTPGVENRPRASC